MERCSPGPNYSSSMKWWSQDLHLSLSDRTPEFYSILDTYIPTLCTRLPRDGESPLIDPNLPLTLQGEDVGGSQSLQEETISAVFPKNVLCVRPTEPVGCPGGCHLGAIAKVPSPEGPQGWWAAMGRETAEVQNSGTSQFPKLLSSHSKAH